MAYQRDKKNLSRFELTGQLVELKQEFEWLNEINAQSLQSALKNLDTAYKNFFRTKEGFPRYKSKRDNFQSYQCPQHVKLDFEKARLYLPKFKEGIKIILRREFTGTIKTVTISRTPTNKYFASILVDDHKPLPDKLPIKEETAVGIDVGIKTFATLSDGRKIENLKFSDKSLHRLKWMQRKFKRKKKGSNRRKRWQRKIAKVHERISNQRSDYLHKVSDAITKQYNTVCIEDLKIKNMVKNKHLARSISDAGWGMFGTYLKYKCEWRGKNLIEIGTFEPSSKTCSVCGGKNADLQLSDREWECTQCGAKLDRDLNAAINIKEFALNKTGWAVTEEDTELADTGLGVEVSSAFQMGCS